MPREAKIYKAWITWFGETFHKIPVPDSARDGVFFAESATLSYEQLESYLRSKFSEWKDYENKNIIS